MFGLVTISNGVVVVQHRTAGHVYRFRPTHPGLWGRLTLDKVETGRLDPDEPDLCEKAAQSFAEEAAERCCDQPPAREPPLSDPASQAPVAGPLAAARTWLSGLR
jgi:hypothetical protein